MECKAEKCLVERTGSCAGCNVLSIVLEKGLLAKPAERNIMAERVRKTLCPDENIMLIPSDARVRQTIW
jgi:hypothetical protein